MHHSIGNRTRTQLNQVIPSAIPFKNLLQSSSLDLTFSPSGPPFVMVTKSILILIGLQVFIYRMQSPMLPSRSGNVSSGGSHCTLLRRNIPTMMKVSLGRLHVKRVRLKSLSWKLKRLLGRCLHRDFRIYLPGGRLLPLKGSLRGHL